MAAEFWVMRIRVRKGGSVDESIARLVDSGDLHSIGDEICEPIECCASQETGLASLLAWTARTGAPHKLVISADPADLVDGIG